MQGEIFLKGTHPSIISHYKSYKSNAQRKYVSILGSTFDIDSHYEIKEAS